MKRYRVKQNPRSHLWDVHKKIFTQRCNFLWVCHKNDFTSKREAEEYIEGRSDVNY